MGDRQSDGFADVLAGGKLEQLLEEYGVDDFTGARDLSDHLVQRSVSCEFLVSKGQLRITYNLRPAESTPAPPEDPGPTV